MGFPRQEYWSGLPCPPLGDLPNPGIKPRDQTHVSCSSCIAGGFFTAEPPLPALWPPHAKSWLIGKDSDAGRNWGQEEKGSTEDEMAGWHHWLDGCKSKWTPGVGDGQGGLACCDSWGCRVGHDWATELNWTTHVCAEWGQSEAWEMAARLYNEETLVTNTRHFNKVVDLEARFQWVEGWMDHFKNSVYNATTQMKLENMLSEKCQS